MSHNLRAFNQVRGLNMRYFVRYIYVMNKTTADALWVRTNLLHAVLRERLSEEFHELYLTLYGGGTCCKINVLRDNDTRKKRGIIHSG